VRSAWRPAHLRLRRTESKHCEKSITFVEFDKPKSSEKG
jgi:hypothetical protein